MLINVCIRHKVTVLDSTWEQIFFGMSIEGYMRIEPNRQIFIGITRFNHFSPIRLFNIKSTLPSANLLECNKMHFVLPWFSAKRFALNQLSKFLRSLINLLLISLTDLSLIDRYDACVFYSECQHCFLIRYQLI